jgi:hypothetical protein
MKRSLYLLSQALFYTSVVFLGFVVISSLIVMLDSAYNWDISFIILFEQNGKTFASVKIPFIETFIQFQYSLLTIVVMWISILFYVIYFRLLSRFFSVFVEEDSFSKESLLRLKHFLYINFLPVIYAIGFTGYQVLKADGFKFEQDHGMAIFHLIIAVIVYLYVDIAKKGNLIKAENDLTI